MPTKQTKKPTSKTPVNSKVVSKNKKPTIEVSKEICEKETDKVISKDKKPTIEVSKETNKVDSIVIENKDKSKDVIIYDKKEDNVEIIEIDIIYKKSNPFIFMCNKNVDPFHLTKNKKFHQLYNAFKYSIALLTILFSILTLYFSSVWQSTIVFSEIKLVNGVLPSGADILAKLFNLNINSFTNASYGIYPITAGTNIIPPSVLKLLTSNIWDLKNTLVNFDMIQALFSFGIIGIFSSIALLAFKNGTAWSVSMSCLSLISFIIVFIIFVLGLVSTAPALSDAKVVSKLLSAATPDNQQIKDALTIFANNFNL